MSSIDNNHLISINNSLIKKNSEKLEIISISWLYIKRLHPHYLNNYKILNKNRLQIFLYSLSLFFINILKFCKLLIKSLGYVESNNVKINQDVLIISHLINKHNYLKGDFYYNHLGSYFKKNNISLKTILINDQSHSKKDLDKNFILLPNLIKSFDLIKIFLNQLIVIPFIYKKILSSNDSLEKKILIVTMSKVICPSTIYNLVKCNQLQNIINKSQIKMCFCNFEGNAIERIIFYTLTNTNKKISKIGYSHTTDFPMRNSVYLDLKKNLMPDFIFLNSRVVFNEFYSKGFKNLVLCGLLSNPSFNILSKSKKTNKDNRVLVIPEGIHDELYKFIKFIKILAKKYPQYEYIIRPHPVLDNISIIKVNNIHISNNTLEKDIQNSKYVFFRGSTLIIHCINNDLVPLYLNYGENYNFHIFPSKFDAKLNIIDSKNINQFNLDNYFLDKNLKKFSMNYFVKYNERVVTNFLKVLNK